MNTHIFLAKAFTQCEQLKKVDPVLIKHFTYCMIDRHTHVLESLSIPLLEILEFQSPQYQTRTKEMKLIFPSDVYFWQQTFFKLWDYLQQGCNNMELCAVNPSLMSEFPPAARPWGPPCCSSAPMTCCLYINCQAASASTGSTKPAQAMHMHTEFTLGTAYSVFFSFNVRGLLLFSVLLCARSCSSTSKLSRLITYVYWPPPCL